MATMKKIAPAKKASGGAGELPRFSRKPGMTMLSTPKASGSPMPKVQTTKGPSTAGSSLGGYKHTFKTPKNVYK